jgi:hypothetical protein
MRAIKIIEFTVPALVLLYAVMTGNIGCEKKPDDGQTGTGGSKATSPPRVSVVPPTGTKAPPVQQATGIAVKMSSISWDDCSDFYAPHWFIDVTNNGNKPISVFAYSVDFGLHFKNNPTKWWRRAQYYQGDVSIASQSAPLRPGESKRATWFFGQGQGEYGSAGNVDPSIFRIDQWMPYGLTAIEMRISWQASDPFGYSATGEATCIHPVQAKYYKPPSP